MATAMHDRIDRMILLDWPDDVSAPSFTHLHPATLPATDLLYIRELTIVTDAARTAIAVSEAVEESASRARSFSPGLSAHTEAVVFASAAQVAAAMALARARPGSLPGWLAEHFDEGQSGLLTPAQSLLASSSPTISVLVHLRSWHALGAVLVAMEKPDHRLIWQCLVRELDLVVEPESDLVDPANGHPDETRAGMVTPPPSDGPARGFHVSRRGAAEGFVVDLAAATIAMAIDQVVRSLDDPARSRHERQAMIPIAPAERAQDADLDDSTEASIAPALNEAPLPESQLGSETQVETRDPKARELEARLENPAVGVGAATGGVGSNDHESVPAAVSEESTTWRPPTVSTGLGGVFYLVNPLSRIDLADFGLDASDPWHLLAGVAHELIDLNHERASDPLWQCLAEWSGDEPADPVVNQAGYEALAAYIRGELAFLPPEPTLSQALCLPAQIVTTDRTIRVYFPLDAADLAVRRRGLDIDPGWIPGFTHAIHFLFGERP